MYKNLRLQGHIDGVTVHLGVRAARRVPCLIAGLLALIVFQSCGKIAGPPAIETLVSGLYNEDQEKRKQSADALLKLGDKSAGLLAEELGKDRCDRNPEAMILIIMLLGSAQSKDSVGKLIPYLEHRDTRIRYVAAQALGEIRDETAVANLAKRLDDGDKLVAKAVHESLVAIVGQDLGMTAAPWESWSKRVR